MGFAAYDYSKLVETAINIQMEHFEEMDLSVEILPVLTPRGDRWFVLFTPSKITAYPRLLDDCLFRQWYVDQGEFFEDSNGTHFFSAEELADHPELRFDS